MLPTVTEIVPVVAFAGIMKTSVVDVAESTVSATPFKVTVLADNVVLKP